jgi:hypothetical protein
MEKKLKETKEMNAAAFKDSDEEKPQSSSRHKLAY